MTACGKLTDKVRKCLCKRYKNIVLHWHILLSLTQFMLEKKVDFLVNLVPVSQMMCFPDRSTFASAKSLQ